MGRYLEPLLKIIIVVVTGMILVRIRHLFKLNKNKPGKLIRNYDGDFFIIILVWVIYNKSYFDKYKLSYQPFIRNIYSIIVFVVISYILLQVTQLIRLGNNLIVIDGNEIMYSDIESASIKKLIIGYKVEIKYNMGDKNKLAYFKTTRNSKELLLDKLNNHKVEITN